MFAITGATGHLGRLAIDNLLTTTPAGRIAAVVRDKDKAADLAARGVEIRVADYDDPASLRDAFREGERVLLISGNEAGRRIPQHRAVIDAAAAAGAASVAYTSVLGGPAADFALADDHKATEQAILDSGLPYTFLRNGWYHENYTGNLAPVLEHAAVVASAGEGRVASAARADYAAGAAAVLAGEGHEGQAYELSGDTAWSFADFAAELSRQTGREIRYAPVAPAERLKLLLGAGLPEAYAAALIDADAAISRGRLAGTSGDLSRLIGRPTTPLADAIAGAL